MPDPVLLLDLDGTLVESNATHAEAFARTAAEAGLPLPRDRFDREIGKGADLLIPDVFGASAERERGDALRDEAGRHFRRLAAERGLDVFEGAREVLEAARARGLTTALATSSSEDDLEAIAESAGLDAREHVDVTLSASEVEDSKPEPDLVGRIAEKVGVPAAACVVVGDTLYDALAARRAGAAFVGVATWVWSEADLEAAGARATYPSTAAFAVDFDGALAAAQPGGALSAGAADALVRAALEEAEAALEAGGLAIGAVVGRADGTVVARGRNRASTGDRLRHAETDALHALMQNSAAADDGLILATSLEPCAMCLGTAVEAGIHAVLYPLEAPPNGADGHLDPLPGRRLPLVSRWDGDHRAASLALLRRSAERRGGFARRLVEAIEAGDA